MSSFCSQPDLFGARGRRRRISMKLNGKKNNDMPRRGSACAVCLMATDRNAGLDVIQKEGHSGCLECASSCIVRDPSVSSSASLATSRTRECRMVRKNIGCCRSQQRFPVALAARRTPTWPRLPPPPRRPRPVPRRSPSSTTPSLALSRRPRSSVPRRYAATGGVPPSARYALNAITNIAAVAFVPSGCRLHTSRSF